MARLEKKHIYRVYQNGTYLGMLPNVKSDFSYNQQINTAGAQLQIVVEQSADTANLPSSQILDMNGNVITDEVNSPLLDEGTAEVVGGANPNALIQNHNDIIVTEYSDYYPNGVVVYDGYISRWKANYGGGEDITITCLNQSQDLAHHITPGSNQSIVDQQQTTNNNPSYLGFTSWSGQAFIVGPGITNLTAIKLSMRSTTGVSQSATLDLYNTVSEASVAATPIASVTQTIGTVAAEYTFTFSSPIIVTPGQSLFWGTSIFNIEIGMSNSKIYTGGNQYLYDHVGGITPVTTQDNYFKTYYEVTTTSKTYTNEDVTDILTDVFDYYVSDGGLVSAPPGGWAATGIIIPTYTMKVTTTLQAIQKIKELGPSDWYWYVDPATNILYYQPQGTTADHYIIKGRHIQMLDIEATKENIINDVLFTGGNDGTGSGENVFVRTKDQDSIDNGRVGLALPVDNRVDGTDGAATATQLSQNLIDRNNAEAYSTTVTIIDGTYDTKLYNMGDMIKPENFGTFPDTLLLLVVARNPIRDGITLTLGVLPRRASEQVEAIQKGLLDAQTLDNPAIPS